MLATLAGLVAAGWAAQAEPAAAPALIVFTETNCYGSCPAYRFAIFPEDEYVMCGFAHVNSPGITPGTLSEGTFAAAADLVLESGVLSDPSIVPGISACGRVYTDAPSMRVEAIFEDGSAREFEWYTGCNMQNGRPHFIAVRARQLRGAMRTLIRYETRVQSEATRDAVTREDFFRMSMSEDSCPIPYPVTRILAEE
jgi:hypothetical protein